MPKLEVCLSPALLHLYDFSNSIVVVIDVFRATSTIASALYNGAKEIVPMDDVQKCIEAGNLLPNSITAGERDGQVAPGLQHGNSPLEYSADFIANKTLLLTTTNGTRLLYQTKNSKQIITGSFVNLSAVCDYLLAQNADVLLACASWKDRYNLEDHLFAGAVVEKIGSHFDINCDSARAGKHLYNAAKNNIYEFIKDSSHFKRLSAFGLYADMEYCCQIDACNVLPIFVNDTLIANPIL
jgi:2-phosphosulfolactate phosphatase